MNTDVKDFFTNPVVPKNAVSLRKMRAKIEKQYADWDKYQKALAKQQDKKN